MVPEQPGWLQRVPSAAADAAVGAVVAALGVGPFAAAACSAPGEPQMSQ
jgi:hypothetical protein